MIPACYPSPAFSKLIAECVCVWKRRRKRMIWQDFQKVYQRIWELLTVCMSSLKLLVHLDESHAHSPSTPMTKRHSLKNLPHTYDKYLKERFLKRKKWNKKTRISFLFLRITEFTGTSWEAERDRSLNKAYFIQQRIFRNDGREKTIRICEVRWVHNSMSFFVKTSHRWSEWTLQLCPCRQNKSCII